MDNKDPRWLLTTGAQSLGLELDPRSAAQLVLYQTELLSWNERVNLISRASAQDVVEKHLLDSLATAPELKSAKVLLDIGSGAGLPGIPLKILMPHLWVGLVESIGKKARFLTHVAERLEAGPGLRIHHVRAAGRPEREGLPRCDAVISRAVLEISSWLPLASSYLLPRGRVIAMLGRCDDATIAEAASSAGLRLASIRRYALPFSGAARAVATFVR